MSTMDDSPNIMCMNANEKLISAVTTWEMAQKELKPYQDATIILISQITPFSLKNGTPNFFQ
jgi:hypothetical protein